MRNISVTKRATLTGHNDCVYAVIGGPESWQVISAAGDGMVVLWDLRDPENGVLLAKVSNSVYSVCHIPGTKMIAIGQNFEGVHLIDLDSKKIVDAVKVSESAIFDMESDGTNLWVADGSGTVYRYDLGTMSLQSQQQFTPKSARNLSRMGNELAVGFSDHQVRVLNAQTLQEQHVLEGHQNSVFTVSYSPEGEVLYSAGRDATIKMWDVSNHYQLRQSIPAHMYAINRLVFSPDGHFFATVSMDKSLKIWSAHDGQLLKVVDKARHAGHATSVNNVFWSTFNNHVITCSDDRTLSVWEITV